MNFTTIDRKNTISLIQRQLQEHDILIYMKGTPHSPKCGFSAQAIAAVHAYRKEIFSVNILEDPSIRKFLPEYSNWPTFPQLYVNSELIGGCDIILELEASGDLENILSV